MDIENANLGSIEIPLILNDSKLTEEIKRWRDIVIANEGITDYELTGLKSTKDGSWLGVFTKK